MNRLFGEAVLAALCVPVYWIMYGCGRLRKRCCCRPPAYKPEPLSPRSEVLRDFEEAGDIDLDDSLEQQQVSLDTAEDSDEAADSSDV